MVKIRRYRSASLLVVLAAALGLAVLPTAAGAASSSDIAAAEAGTIQQSDVPADFTESSPMKSQAGPPPGSSASNQGLDKQVKNIPVCKGFVKVFQPTGKTVTASADGASFDKSETLGGSTLSGSTLIFKSSADAKKFFVPIKSSKLSACLDKAMKASIQESLTSGAGSQLGKFESSIQKVSAPKLGDETAAYSIKFDVGAPAGSGTDFSMQIYFGMEFVRTGRGIGAYVSMSTGAPDDATAQSAIKDAVGRMQTALG
jgi:hypothetical protein